MADTSLANNSSSIDAGDIEHFRRADHLLRECKAACDVAGLDTAIFLLRYALHIWQPVMLQSDMSKQVLECADRLGIAQLMRFAHTSQLDDVVQGLALRYNAGTSSISTIQFFISHEDFELNPEDGHDPTKIMCLGLDILEKVHHDLDHAALNEAVDLFYDVLKQRSSASRPDPILLRLLFHTADALLLRFHVGGQEEDLRAAESLLEELLRHQPIYGSSLCAALASRTHISTQALSSAKELCAAIVQDKEEALRQFDVGAELSLEIQNGSSFARLDDAILAFESAHVRLSRGHPDRWAVLANLAQLLSLRWARAGNAPDLDRAVELYKYHLVLAPHGDAQREAALGHLGNIMFLRFRRWGSFPDLDTAIAYQRERINLCTDSHPSRPKALDELGDSLCTRFVEMRNIKDIDESVISHRKALDLLPHNHPMRGQVASNLRSAISQRYDELGGRSDLDEMQETGSWETLDQRIESRRVKLTLCPPPHLSRGDALLDLAEALTDIYLRKRSAPYIGFADEAMLMFREASTYKYSSPIQCFKTARIWAQRAHCCHHSTALEAYRIAIDLLPQLGPLGMDPFLRQKALSFRSSGMAYDAATAESRATEVLKMTAVTPRDRSIILGLGPVVASMLSFQSPQRRLRLGIAGLASDAMACAIGLNKNETALEFLEQGRSVFWFQELQLRTALNELLLVKHDLAQTATNILDQLQSASSRMPTLTATHRSPSESIYDPEAPAYGGLSREWIRVVNDIRNVEGFEGFMRPKELLSDFRTIAHRGHIIVLNAGSSSCDAMILCPDGSMQHVALDITLDDVTHLAQLLRELPSSTAKVNNWLGPLFGISGLQFDGVLFEDEADSEEEKEDGKESISGLQYESVLFGDEVDSEEKEGGKEKDGENFERATESINRLKGRVEQDDNDQASQRSNAAFGLILRQLWETIVKPVIEAIGLKKTTTPPRVWWCPTGPLTLLPIHASGIYTEGETDCVSEYCISSYTPTMSALFTHRPPVAADATSTFKMSTVIEPGGSGHARRLPKIEEELSKIKAHVPKEWLTVLRHTSPKAALEHLPDSSIVHFACHGTQDFKNSLDSGLVLAQGLLKISEIMSTLKGATESDTDRGRPLKLAFLSACETAKGDDKVPDESMHIAAALIFAGFQGVVATMW
ncbi:CHAT domain-containing protein [Mycena crocata]|nr:CHAT domain-containing protein [Mycena crocata]